MTKAKAKAKPKEQADELFAPQQEPQRLVGNPDHPQGQPQPAQTIEHEPAKPLPKATPKTDVATRTAKPDVARTAPSTDAVGIMQVIERLALNKDVDPDKLDRLISMQERILDRNAKAAFDMTLAEIQPKLPIIGRKGLIEVRAKDSHGERTGKVLQSTKYPKYEDIVEAIKPILAEHGFGLRFKTGLDDQGRVRVVGILSGCGHREEAEFILPHDSTGSKNSVQAIGSSTSYGKRMAACALLNIVSRDEDDDGHAGGKPIVIGEPLTQEQLEVIIELAGAVECREERLVKHLNSVRPKGHPEMEKIASLPTGRFDEAVKSLHSYEANRKEREAAKAKTRGKSQ